MTFQDMSNDDLLAQYVRLFLTDQQGRQENKRADLYAEIIKRMKSPEPSKTEETTFGMLTRDDEFFDKENNRNLVVGHSGSIVALPLEGMRKNIVWWPGVGFPVKKIVKVATKAKTGRWAESPGTGP